MNVLKRIHLHDPFTFGLLCVEEETGDEHDDNQHDSQI